MSLPSFYISSYHPGQHEVVLDEDNSRHIVQVLRIRPGESLQLTDGKGALLTAEIIDDHKKKCRVAIRSVLSIPPPATRVTIAISPLKNVSRLEWFLEKATEIGVGVIIPLLCERTERPSIRHDRLQQILVSAMLQSQRAWMPDLQPATSFPEVIRQTSGQTRYIAHCLEKPRPTEDLAVITRQTRTTLPITRQTPTNPPVQQETPAPAGSSLILIGPEGDFSAKEVENALTAGCIPVTLGPSRLRTETAGVVAAVLLCLA